MLRGADRHSQLNQGISYEMIINHPQLRPCEQRPDGIVLTDITYLRLERNKTIYEPLSIFELDQLPTGRGIHEMSLQQLADRTGTKTDDIRQIDIDVLARLGVKSPVFSLDENRKFFTFRGGHRGLTLYSLVKTEIDPQGRIATITDIKGLFDQVLSKNGFHYISLRITNDSGAFLGNHAVGVIVDHETEYYTFFEPNDKPYAWNVSSLYEADIIEKLKAYSNNNGGIVKVVSYF